MRRACLLARVFIWLLDLSALEMKLDIAVFAVDFFSKREFEEVNELFDRYI